MAAGGNIVNSSTNVYQAAPLPRPEEVEPPAWTPPTLPLRTTMFVGRNDELAELDAALADPGGVVVQAVHGLGGVGKSALAAQWAHRHADAHVLTWWITADSMAAVTSGLADLARMLVPEMTRSTPGAIAQEEQAAWAQRWLAAHTGWLVVLDNVTNPADVAQLVTSAPSGRFLVTSRLREGWYDLAPALIELDVLSASESQELLARIAASGRPAADLDGVAELCAELGYLPLAVKQAGAYIRQTHLSPRAYLELLRTDPAALYDQTARGADPQRTIARIWRVTLDHLAATAPLTGDVLRILAWWAPADIPRRLLAPLSDPVQIATALGDLAAYNMITLDADTITVHRLVQAVARTPDPDDPHRHATDIDHARGYATRLLKEAVPTDYGAPTGWPLWRTLVPHIDALTSFASPTTSTATTARLLDRTGLFLSDQGDSARAITYHQHALTTFERVLGTDHAETVASRNGLARAHQSAGNSARAIPLFSQVLADFERILGPDHRDTLISRSDLAKGHMLEGHVARAVTLFRQVLADFERILGPDHPETLISRHNLARGYMAAENTVRAIPLSQQALVDLERVFGPDHPNTLAARYTLAHAYQSAGDLVNALPLFVKILAAEERVLGADHPTALGSRNSLARSYLMVGDLIRAIPLFEENLSARERVLGHDHPHTLGSRGNLAHAYEMVGDLGRAIRLYEQTLVDCERVLESDHPFTMSVRANLQAVRGRYPRR
ncbi:FxSxx-COOH system tetratricopeptide repeat protein [Actinomadura sp. 1N219]|uniref:FxSxx-COOH system tetratricopeptide repeat protein n=1 Tax=Actinomadura sp. 1N219 TaxID=3375152 RepID=UPI00379AA029